MQGTQACSEGMDAANGRGVVQSDGFVVAWCGGRVLIEAHVASVSTFVCNQVDVRHAVVVVSSY